MGDSLWAWCRSRSTDAVARGLGQQLIKACPGAGSRRSRQGVLHDVSGCGSGSSIHCPRPLAGSPSYLMDRVPLILATSPYRQPLVFVPRKGGSSHGKHPICLALRCQRHFRPHLPWPRCSTLRLPSMTPRTCVSSWTRQYTTHPTALERKQGILVTQTFPKHLHGRGKRNSPVRGDAGETNKH